MRPLNQKTDHALNDWKKLTGNNLSALTDFCRIRIFPRYSADSLKDLCVIALHYDIEDGRERSQGDNLSFTFYDADREKPLFTTISKANRNAAGPFGFVGTGESR